MARKVVVMTVDRVHAVTIDLPEHGEFKARMGDVTYAHRTYSKRALARAIVDGYGGGCGTASTMRHWLVYDKWVLAIVYCGMIAPLN